jgi:hypothetical protein
VDASFAVHKDLKSHTGATMSVGTGVIQSLSVKQKVTTRSSIEAEFLEAQGYKIKQNVIFRDNQGSMKLEQKGKASSGKHTRHFNIKYFYITALIKNGEVLIEYCPTNAILVDYMTKPLTGANFVMFRQLIMNLPGASIVHRSVLENISLGHADDWILEKNKSAWGKASLKR